MPLPIPPHWRYAPPESLVVGKGAYAAALASVFKAEAITFENLRDGLKWINDSSYPQVLSDLARVFLVMSGSMSAADALQCHEAVWDWVGRLAPAGDQHELVFVFILTSDESKEFEDALAVGLSIAEIDPATTGHAVWRSSGALTELVCLLASVQPMDLLPLRARRTSDVKYATLERLRATVSRSDATAVRDAAREVLVAFSGSEYLLDVFCRPPSHRHGNLLRKWLTVTVTESVTQHWMEEAKQLTGWLVPARSVNTR